MTLQNDSTNKIILLFSGKAYGIFNLRTVYIASLIMFEAGSALCGGSPNMNALIVGRIWAGMGGAGIYLGQDFSGPATKFEVKLN